MQRTEVVRRARLLALAALAAVVAGFGPGGPGAVEALAQDGPEAAVETFHWVLPADAAGGVEVATLHPADCYIVHRAEGVVHFGARTPALDAWQRRLPPAGAHPVETFDAHGACADARCLDVAGAARGLEEALASADGRRQRRADHRPSPVDHWYGGAYTDVGSDDRTRFRNGPEQRMLFRHLATARRGNCYEAKALRVLTIHVRDHERRARRSGVYHGLLTVRHRHAGIRGSAAD